MREDRDVRVTLPADAMLVESPQHSTTLMGMVGVYCLADCPATRGRARERLDVPQGWHSCYAACADPGRCRTRPESLNVKPGTLLTV